MKLNTTIGWLVFSLALTSCTSAENTFGMKRLVCTTRTTSEPMQTEWFGDVRLMESGAYALYHNNTDTYSGSYTPRPGELCNIEKRYGSE